MTPKFEHALKDDICRRHFGFKLQHRRCAKHAKPHYPVGNAFIVVVPPCRPLLSAKLRIPLGVILAIYAYRVPALPPIARQLPISSQCRYFAR